MSEEELTAADFAYITSRTGWPVETECVQPGKWWATSGTFAEWGISEHTAIMNLLEAVQSH